MLYLIQYNRHEWVLPLNYLIALTDNFICRFQVFDIHQQFHDVSEKVTTVAILHYFLCSTPSIPTYMACTHLRFKLSDMDNNAKENDKIYMDDNVLRCNGVYQELYLFNPWLHNLYLNNILLVFFEMKFCSVRYFSNMSLSSAIVQIINPLLIHFRMQVWLQ